MRLATGFLVGFLQYLSLSIESFSSPALTGLKEQEGQRVIKSLVMAVRRERGTDCYRNGKRLATRWQEPLSWFIAGIE